MLGASRREKYTLCRQKWCVEQNVLSVNEIKGRRKVNCHHMNVYLKDSKSVSGPCGCVGVPTQTVNVMSVLLTTMPQVVISHSAGLSLSQSII